MELCALTTKVRQSYRIRSFVSYIIRKKDGTQEEADKWVDSVFEFEVWISQPKISTLLYLEPTTEFGILLNLIAKNILATAQEFLSGNGKE